MPSTCGVFLYSDVTSVVTKKHCQAEVGGIQGAIESVCCLSFMRECLRKRLDEVGDIVWKLIGGAVTC